jgi:hypothetical protein
VNAVSKSLDAYSAVICAEWAISNFPEVENQTFYE